MGNTAIAKMAPQFFLILFCFSPLSDAYDALDPQGNVTIRWDVKAWEDGISGYTAIVSIFNNQRYRHVEKPGWRVGWTWPNKEVIWDARGGEATEQGNCSRFHGGSLPHCCKKNPIFVDLLPDTPYNYRVANCCRGGLLSSTTQDSSRSVASFQLTVGDALYLSDSNATENRKVDHHIMSLPTNFHFLVPGYTCGSAFHAPPTEFPVHHGRRKTQALRTWKIICTYSAMKARPAPSCCVSLSAFYNDTIVGCPRCSCACESNHPSLHCVREGEVPPLLQLPVDESGIEEMRPVVMCSPHMCPIRVHWHVKLSYRDYWRVKVTITNFNLVKNYSEWNLVVQHPNLQNLTHVFSFNYQPLSIYPLHNDSGVFWGIKYYNDMLLSSGEMGNVQTEILLRKDPDEFSFRAGWAFPRKIYFNGEQCVMPLPDVYPRLPNAAFSSLPPPPPLTLPLSLFLFLVFSTWHP